MPSLRGPNASAPATSPAAMVELIRREQERLAMLLRDANRTAERLSTNVTELTRQAAIRLGIPDPGEPGTTVRPTRQHNSLSWRPEVDFAAHPTPTPNAAAGEHADPTRIVGCALSDLIPGDEETASRVYLALDVFRDRFSRMVRTIERQRDAAGGDRISFSVAWTEPDLGMFSTAFPWRSFREEREWTIRAACTQLQDALDAEPGG